jgi:hypothetical protein
MAANEVSYVVLRACIVVYCFAQHITLGALCRDYR